LSATRLPGTGFINPTDNRMIGLKYDGTFAPSNGDAYSMSCVFESS
jgi:hypothetical protein